MKKLLAATAALALLLGALFVAREEVVLFFVAHARRPEIAPNRPIEWMRGPASSPEASSPRPPNIIFILADDLGMNDLSVFGGGVAGGAVPTPNIDRIGAGGAIFSNSYSGTASCAPSRAMLMTGRYPTRTGFEFTPLPDGMARVLPMFAREMKDGVPSISAIAEHQGSLPPFYEQGLPSEEVTIAEVLRERGYHTVHIGKWHLGNAAPFRPRDQGFDESLELASGLFLPLGDPRGVEARLDFDPIDRFLWAAMDYAATYNDSPWFEPGGYLTDYWTEESMKVIEANKNRPFFLYLAHWAVHTPLQATREDYEAVGEIEPHRLRVYAAMIRALDRSVGRILEKLEEEGLAESTLIVFSSDNGAAGYLGLPEVNRPYRGWKLSLFEGGIRVPLFLRWPSVIPEGTVIEEPVAHIDLMPTLASVAGASLPAGVTIDGKDLLPLARGEGEFAREDDAIFWSSGYYRAVRSGGWKLQVNSKQNATWLFNLDLDPTEQNELSATEPQKVLELRRLMDAHFGDAREPLYPPVLEGPIMVDKTAEREFEEGDEYVFWPN